MTETSSQPESPSGQDSHQPPSAAGGPGDPPAPPAAHSYWYRRDPDEAPTRVGPQPVRPGGDLTPGRSPIRHRRGRWAAVVAGTAVVALASGFGGGVLSGQSGSRTAVTDSSLSQQSAAAPVSASLATADTTTVEQVASAVLPSVVSILATSGNSAEEGSGIILTKDGLILTNNHVIASGTLTVRFNDGTTATATVVGADATDDLAVIKAAGVSGLTPSILGTSDDLKVGQPVVAIGTPLGLSATVTSGIVSAINRPVRTSAAQDQQTGASTSAGSVLNAIQTDAAINPGNSGGPLVDMQGRIIGINSAIASLSTSSSSQAGSIGVGFAIPIDQAKRIAQEIINTGTATHAVFGAALSDNATSATAIPDGALVGEITTGGAAQLAGIRTGDVITKVGALPVDSADALIAAIRSLPPGTTVTISYLRGTATATAAVTLGRAT